MPEPLHKQPHELRLHIAGDGSVAATSSAMISWLIAEGIPTAPQHQPAAVLGPTEWIPVIIASTGSLASLITSLASFARARAATIVIRSPDGREAVVHGQLGKPELAEIAKTLSAIQSNDSASPDGPH